MLKEHCLKQVSTTCYNENLTKFIILQSSLVLAHVLLPTATKRNHTRTKTRILKFFHSHWKKHLAREFPRKRKPQVRTVNKNLTDKSLFCHFSYLITFFTTSNMSSVHCTSGPKTSGYRKKMIFRTSI